MNKSLDSAKVTCVYIKRLIARLDTLGFQLSEIKQPDYHFLSYTYILKGDKSKLSDYPEYHNKHISRDNYSFSCKCCGHIVEIISLKFDDIANSSSEGLFWIKKNGRFGFADTSEKIVIPPEYDAVCRFSEGLAPVRINGKWGFINKKNKIVIQPVFEQVGYFSEGLASFQLADKWGFIDTKGNPVIKPQYSYAYEFSNGVAVVLQEMKYFNLDKNGTLTIRYCKGITQSGSPCRKIVGLDDYCSSHLPSENEINAPPPSSV